jgi:hypothetical protein
MLDKEKVLDYLQRTKQKKATIKHDGRLYLVRLKTDPGNQFSDPQDYASIEELPPVIELVF